MVSKTYSPTVTLNVGPIYTRVKFSQDVDRFYSKQVMNELRRIMRGRPEGYRHMPKYKSRRWDGWISLMKRNSFPSGLNFMAEDVLKSLCEDMEMDFKVSSPHIPNTPLSSVLSTHNNQLVHGEHKLRKYQVDAARALLRAKRGVAHMATNAGKTLVMAAICNVIGGRALIIVHSKELLYQIGSVMRKNTKLGVGLIGDGHFDIEEGVIVATIQSLSNKLDELSSFFETVDILMIDEVHHASARTVYDTAMKIPAKWRYGFSGTPLKHRALDDLRLMAVTGEIVTHISNETLIQDGYSATPDIVMHRHGNGVTDKGLNYQDAYEVGIVSNKYRNLKIIKIAEKAAKEDKVVLLLVSRIIHQKEIADMLNERGMVNDMYTVVNGMHTTRTRNGVLEMMRSGQPGIYIATNIFGEGVDIPAIDMLIIAGGGKSHIRLLQQVGRGLRKKDGENRVDIIDFLDRGNKYLREHADLRLMVYRNEGFDVKVVGGKTTDALPTP